MLVLVGPTGNVGAELAQLVVSHDPPLDYRLAGHNPQRIRAQLGASAVVAPFDYDDRTTWPAVLDGARTVFLLFPLPSPRTVNTRMKPFIDAAAAAGVEHFVYISVPGADTQTVVPHYAVERHIEATGVPYTFLRPTYFMQNLCRAISTHGVDIARHNEIFIPARRGLTSFIDSRDVAHVALDAIRRPEVHRNRAYVLSGPELLDFEQVAAVLSEELGRPIRYTDPSLPAFWLRLARRGVRWDAILFMTGVYTLTRRGRNAQMTDTLPPLLGRPPTTLRQFARDYRWRWEQEAWT